MTTLTQRTFSSGEISPSLYARTDLSKYATGLRTCLNNIVLRYGGVSNRPGTSFIAELKSEYFDYTGPVRIISFIVSHSESYVLVFQSNEIDTGVIWVYSKGVYVGGITDSPYLGQELRELKYAQSANTLIITHPNYPPKILTLVSSGPPVWSFTDIAFKPATDAPIDMAAAAGPGGSDIHKYQVTSIDKDTGEESLPGAAGFGATNYLTITGITPGIFTRVDYVNVSKKPEVGDEIYLKQLVGIEELNDRVFVVDESTNDYCIIRQDSTKYGTYFSGGRVYSTFAKITAGDPTSTSPHVILWTAPDNAEEFNIYKEYNGSWGLLGITSSTTFKDIGVSPDTSKGSPRFDNPFLGEGNYPAVVTFIQQRLALANTNNDQEKIFLSQVGKSTNFTSSRPLKDSDAIKFKIAGKQKNIIAGMLDLGKFIILSSSGEWSATGDDAGTLTPYSLNPKQYSYNGSGILPPLVIDGTAIYQQARGSIVRDLTFDYQVDGYTGNDLTIFSAHLFDKYSLTDWTYQQVPHSILWIARSDGKLLGMTYVRNQQVRAWHVHDLGGFVNAVTVVPEDGEDVLYVSIDREINGSTVTYLERMNTRQITKVEDAIFMDSTATFDGNNTKTHAEGGTLSILAPDVNGRCLMSSGNLNSLLVGDALHVTQTDGSVIRYAVVEKVGPTQVRGVPQRTAPTIAYSTLVWGMALRTFYAPHLKDVEVSVFADGVVVASPNNTSYDKVTASLGGYITLAQPYVKVHIGLPYISDLETLDVDTAQGQTVIDRKKFISEVTLYVEETRGLWTGGKPPEGDDLVKDLIESKIRSSEDYESPVSLITDTVTVKIKPNWNSNGRIFVRQIDPVPMTILSVNPAGKIPFGG